MSFRDEIANIQKEEKHRATRYRLTDEQIDRLVSITLDKAASFFYEGIENKIIQKYKKTHSSVISGYFNFGSDTYYRHFHVDWRSEEQVAQYEVSYMNIDKLPFRVCDFYISAHIFCEDLKDLEEKKELVKTADLEICAEKNEYAVHIHCYATDTLIKKSLWKGYQYRLDINSYSYQLYDRLSKLAEASGMTLEPKIKAEIHSQTKYFNPGDTVFFSKEHGFERLGTFEFYYSVSI